jgi:TonB-dependent starch-binding outer membrane protein SusC
MNIKILLTILWKHRVPFLLAVLLYLPFAAQAQVLVTGTVSDSTAAVTMPGVNIIIKGTTAGATTDSDGKYTIEVPDANSVLVFSAIGYATREVRVGGRTVLDVNLPVDEKTLTEVVVVGYGTSRKAEITSAVSVIDMRTLGNPPAANAGRLLMGQAPGVQVRQTQGRPGAEMEVTVRGVGSLGAGSAPLYVVDGFPVGTAIGQSLNPSDIESITVLKDAASTAIYGARGSNGVVLITTRSPKTGQVSLTFDINTGIQSLPASRSTKMMNGVEFAQFKKESFIDRIRYNENREPDISEIPEEFRYPEQTKHSTNWLKEITNKNALFQNYNMGASVGGAKFRSYLSAGYLNQEGLILKTGLKRYNVRANMEGNVNDFISVGWNIAGANFTERYASTNYRDGLVGRALWADPRYPVYNEDGSFNAYIGGSNGVFGTANPVQELYEMDRHLTQTNLLTNGYVQLSFLKHFKFKTSVSATLVNNERMEFRPSTLAGTGFSQPPPQPATKVEDYFKSTNVAADQLLTYSNRMGDHSLEVLAGYTAQEYTEKSILGTGNTFADDIVRILDAAKTRDVASDEASWSLLAYFGRVNYSYKDKYLFSGSFRREGSSRFGINSKWGSFPAASVGWRVSEESFMPEVSWLTDLKLRASIGVTGNNNIGNYPSLAAMVSSNYVLGNALANGKILGSFANADLGWEQSQQTDIGLDLGLFDNKLTLLAEYYHRTTDNMLLSVQIPAIAGFNNAFSNVGKVENKGVEFALDYRTRLNEINLRSSFNISFNRNKVLAIRGGNDAIWQGGFYDGHSVSRVGRPIGIITGYKVLGIFNTEEEIAAAPTQDGAIPGVYRYLDKDNDGVISYASDDRDMVEIGNPNPDFTWGLTLGGDYKGFDINILFTGAQHYDLYRNIESTTMNMDGVFNVLQSGVNRWRSNTQRGDGVGPASNTWKWERESNSRYVHDASHMWIRNVSLGYTFPKISVFQSIRVFVNADNLLLVSGYPGGNPEVNIREGTQPGFDEEAYPLPRTLSVGASIKF